jgi:hypothetical protein
VSVSMWARASLALGVVVLVGCTSPEAARTRGEARGADAGNRRGDVRLHDGPAVYYRTPTEGPGIGRAEVVGGGPQAG